MKRNTSLKGIVVLVLICLLTAVAMAAVNAVTAPRIETANARARDEALSEVLPDNAGFEALDVDGLPESVEAVYADKDGEGIALMLSIKGYDSSKPMSVAVGFTDGGEIVKVAVVSASGETTGIGSKVTLPEFLSQFSGRTESLDGVDAISGATISSQAFIDAVRESFSVVAEVRGATSNE